MNLTKAINSLQDCGLNIFLSVKVSDLPEDLYPFTQDQKNKTLCLLASGGKKLWENLPHPLTIEDHPIESFSKKVMMKFASDFLKDDIEILYPADSSILPLQKIGRAMNLCRQSPIGIDIHPDYGLWFAFRGIFLTNLEISTPTPKTFESPCDSCSDRPCMNFTNKNQARLNCPIKTQHRYCDEQITYHQQALERLKF